MTSATEILLYAVLNYVPNALIALYAFRKSLRFSFFITVLLFLSAAAVESALFLMGTSGNMLSPVVCTFLSVFIILGLYMFSITARWGRKLFNLFMIKNAANAVAFISKGLEGFLFPKTACESYIWTSSLCVFLVLIIEIPLLILFLDRFFTKDIRDSISTGLWSYLWLVPCFFYLMWILNFYYLTDDSIQTALKPAAMVYSVLFVCGQFFVYACLSKLVISFNNNIILNEYNYRLSQQSLQYNDISAKIHETAILRHDLRHHMITLNGLYKSGRMKELGKYIEDISAKYSSDTISYCTDTALNLLLNHYAGICAEKDIGFNVNICIKDSLPLSDPDITVLFGNILENAENACSSMDISGAKIEICAIEKQDKYIFEISNTYSNELRRDTMDNLLSTKHPGEAYGIMTMKHIIQKNNGIMEISAASNIFTVKLIF